VYEEHQVLAIVGFLLRIPAVHVHLSSHTDDTKAVKATKQAGLKDANFSSVQTTATALR
jgi:hypothetical protein